MLKSEFEERFKTVVSYDEYEEIEKAYYGFEGNKNEFVDIMLSLLDNPKLMDCFLVTCAVNDNKHFLSECKDYRVQAWDEEGDTIMTSASHFHFLISAETFRKSRIGYWDNVVISDNRYLF